MGRNTTEAEVIVTLNGQAAHDELARLEKDMKFYRDAAEEAYKKGKKALGDEMAKEAERLGKEVKVAKKEMKDFSDVINNLSKKSIKELEQAAKQLERQLKNLAKDDPAWDEKAKQYQQITARLKDMKAAYKGVAQEQENWLKRLNSVSNAFMFLNQVATYITGLSMKFRQCAEDAAKLDDVFADVMKTTGLMHEEVAELDKELMKIDTRTSREQLLLLARDAGKLGIQGKEDILGFVRAADQIQVALGEDLGEGAIKNLGKIADVFGLTKEMGIEKSLLSIASAVNALGQASTASEAYLVDFTQRLAGVGAMAGLSVQDILGFASGLDQSAMKVEMAATAFQKFLMKMYEEPAKFAEYAGMEVEKFSELLKTNANEAITTVMKAMNGQDGFAALVPMFDQMGLDGARAVTVLASMTQNLEAVTEAQALANEEFAKGTSVTEEYTTKNNNLQAQLEKARKEFHNASIALGQSLNPIMLKSTKVTTYLIKALASYGKEIRNAAIAVAILTAAIKAKNIVQGISNGLAKASITLTKTKVVVVNLLKVAYFKLTKQTEAAAVAQAALNGAMNASVFGLIATAVAGLTVAITRLVKKAREANEVMDKMSEINKRINSEYAEGASKVQVLTNIVHNNNLELGQRLRALNELKSIVPGYHADLTKEGQLINDNTEALKEYLKNLEKVTRQKILQEEYEKAVADVMNAEKELETATKAKDEALVNAGGNAATENITTTTMMFDGQQWQQEIKQQTPYGAAVDAEASAQNVLNEKKAVQLEIEQRINNEFGIRAGQISDEDKAIRDINDKYKQLINDTKEMYRDNPTAGNERIEELKEQQKTEIAKIHENAAEQRAALTDENNTTNAILTQAQFDYLQERSDKLTKKEKEIVKKEYSALSEEESKALKARYDKLMKADNKAADQRYQQAIKDLEQRQRAEQNILNDKYFNQKITAEEHERQLRDITMKYLLEKRTLAEDNHKDVTAIDEAIFKEQMKVRKEDYDKELKQLKDAQRQEETELMEARAAGKITQKEYEDQMLEIKYDYILKRMQLAKKMGQDETAIMQEWLDLQVEATKAAMDKMDKMKARAKEITAEMNPKDERKARLEAELKELDELHDAKLLSEEDYRKKVKELNKQYNKEQLDEDLANVQKYTELVGNIMSQASNFVSSLKEAETAKLEAEYQAQLTAAGDNAERREQIEAEYEQKKLDLQKKYADVDMVIQIAQAVSAGALAAIQAFTAAKGDPVLGGVYAAIIAATTAAQIATIMAQRNAIKATSVNSSSTSGVSNTNTFVPGTRTMTGYSGGGFTDSDASDAKPVGIVHANEWVAPAPLVRKNPVLFRNLENYRLANSRGRSPLNRGFADGGFTGKVPSNDTGNAVNINISDIEAAVETAISHSMANGAIRAYLVRKDLTELDAQTDRFKKQTKR